MGINGMLLLYYIDCFESPKTVTKTMEVKWVLVLNKNLAFLLSLMHVNIALYITHIINFNKDACEYDKSVLSVHMFVDRSIIPIDIPEEIVLSHEVRIHLCCWSLTTDSHCLGWLGCHGQFTQFTVQSEI